MKIIAFAFFSFLFAMPASATKTYTVQEQEVIGEMAGAYLYAAEANHNLYLIPQCKYLYKRPPDTLAQRAKEVTDSAPPSIAKDLKVFSDNSHPVVVSLRADAKQFVKDFYAKQKAQLGDEKSACGATLAILAGGARTAAKRWKEFSATGTIAQNRSF